MKIELDGMFRWLNSSSSLFFDPAIARYVSTLERKLALLLSTECTRLGANVIFASTSRSAYQKHFSIEAMEKFLILFHAG